MTSMRIVYGIGGMVMRKEAWDSASKQDIAIQTKIGKKLMKKTLKYVRRDNARALKAMKREGMKVIETPPEVLEEFEAEAVKMWNKGVGDSYTQAELDMVLEHRKAYREKKAKRQASK